MQPRHLLSGTARIGSASKETPRAKAATGLEHRLSTARPRVRRCLCRRAQLLQRGTSHTSGQTLHSEDNKIALNHVALQSSPSPSKQPRASPPCWSHEVTGENLQQATYENTGERAPGSPASALRSSRRQPESCFDLGAGPQVPFRLPASSLAKSLT